MLHRLPTSHLREVTVLRKPVYLDYAATTPVDPSVAERMMTCLTLDGVFANPASRSHRYGWEAEEQVETARAQVAALIGADPRDIVWTSGATEANNLALKGAAEAYRKQHETGGTIIISAIEHKAVLDPATWLETQGFNVIRLVPDAVGRIEPAQLLAALTKDTFLVSIMMANNELGTINDVKALAGIARDHGAQFHTDAAQAVGKIAVDVTQLGVDMLSISAHKFYGPKGVGALYVRRQSQKPACLIHGGGHERGMRSGTLPTHQLVGIGSAAEIAATALSEEMASIASLRDRLWNGLSSLPNIRRNGCSTTALPGLLNVAFQGLDGEMLLLSLRDVALSSGSACNSATMSPSYVLKSIGLSDDAAQASLRFSIGRFTTEAEIDFVIDHVVAVVTKLYRA